MDIKTIIKEITLTDNKLELSVEVDTPSYNSTIRAPRIEVYFDCGRDNRRFTIPVNSYEKDINSEKGVTYATYIYAMESIFWNCVWKTCQMSFDVEYDGIQYEKVAFEVEFVASDQNQMGTKKGKIFEFTKDTCEISLPKAIDCTLNKEPNVVQCILAMLLRLANGVLGILLLPWFFIDVCGMMFLGTEKKDENLPGSTIKKLIMLTGWRYFGFCRNKKGFSGMKRDTFVLIYMFFSACHPKKKGVLFVSSRRNDLTGNFENVHECMKADQLTDIRYWLNPAELQQLSYIQLMDLAKKAGRAKVILVDDYTPLLEWINLSQKTKLIQLWHACGAFKTFGFSRVGKKGGPVQTSVNHRRYDYSFVSSQSIAKYYAEGFGLAKEKVVSYGVPRTDMFFDEEKKQEIISMLYTSYPALEGKKVILFAPTFRGNGKVSAFYEAQRFEPNRFIEQLSEEYVLIIKHHPFVTMKYNIDEKNKNRIFDFSKESEINDLLFITDVLITDYSSVVYEASLLNIPMLFYAYDLENYIASRDFYSGYQHFVPGKIVRTQEGLCESILKRDFEQEKVDAFCKENFDIRDGMASKRVAEFIETLL